MAAAVCCLKNLQGVCIVAGLIIADAGIHQGPGDFTVLAAAGIRAQPLLKQPVTQRPDIISKRPCIHVVAAGKDRIVDMPALSRHAAHSLIDGFQRSLAVPERLIPRDVAPQCFPAGHSLIHTGKGLGVPFTDDNPEIFILQDLHFLRIPLAGHQQLPGEQIRVFVAQGNIGHSSLGLSRAINAVHVHAVSAHDIKKQAADERQPVCPLIFIRGHHSQLFHQIGGILRRQDNTFMPGLLCRRGPDSRPVALEKGRGHSIDIGTGVGHEKQQGIFLLRIVVFRQIQVIRHGISRLRIRVDILPEPRDVRLDHSCARDFSAICLHEAAIRCL